MKPPQWETIRLGTETLMIDRRGDSVTLRLHQGRDGNTRTKRVTAPTLSGALVQIGALLLGAEAARRREEGE